jgi:cytochrome P450
MDPTTNLPVSRAKFRNQFMTTQFGALDTTVGSMWLALKILAEQPHCLDSVREELEKYKAERTTKPGPAVTIQDVGLDYDELVKLPVLNAAYRELLRMTSPGPMGARYVSKDMDFALDDKLYRVAKGENLWVGYAPTVMLSPDISSPLLFNPARFLGPNPEASKPYALPYFGVGLRLCPGQKLAEAELKNFLALLAVGKFQCQLDPDRRCVWKYSPTPVAANGCWLTVTKAAG